MPKLCQNETFHPRGRSSWTRRRVRRDRRSSPPIGSLRENPLSPACVVSFPRVVVAPGEHSATRARRARNPPSQRQLASGSEEPPPHARTDAPRRVPTMSMFARATQRASSRTACAELLKLARASALGVDGVAASAVGRVVLNRGRTRSYSTSANPAADVATARATAIAGGDRFRATPTPRVRASAQISHAAGRLAIARSVSTFVFSEFSQVRSIHWSPYDLVGVVNAVP
eukprot:30566-Pelagococcus_subviridis.AAC.12